ncbi:MAG: DMT family transporter [Gammaproteobacteria bacterium]|nr:DMT family transporter [Gammaproteobacteria bacterium]
MHFNKIIVIGSLFVILGEVFFTTMGMIIKTLGENIPSYQLVFYRNVFAVIVLAPFLFRQRLTHVKTNCIGMHLIRSITGLMAMYCFFYALANIELANAMLLKLTGPIFIPIIAILWIHEKVSAKTYFGIALGFFGVIVFLNPTAEVQFASIIGLIGGALAAAAKVSIRKMSDTEPTARIVFYFAFFGTLFSSVPMLTNETYSPNSQEWLLLISLGLVGTVGQFFLTKAYHMAPASQVGPFTYSSIIWASLAGWFFWNEWPAINTFIGATLIITAGLVILYSKKPSNE